ncbi:hypothetical protein NKY44_17135 [Sinorhizobium meliloti]|uniref:hypothetical protein n=1 Tax=Rhizobium meliloti TaxID=382 RepID=UPI003D655086
MAQMNALLKETLVVVLAKAATTVLSSASRNRAYLQMRRGHARTACAAQPKPTHSVMDADDGLTRNVKAFSYLGLRFLTLEREDFPRLFLCKLNSAASLATAMGAMNKSIGLVLMRRFPGEVLLRDTPEMAFSTRMRGLMLWRRRRPVHDLAEEPCYFLGPTIPKHGRVAFAGFGEWPNQALVAPIGQHNLAVKFLRHSGRCVFARVQCVLALGHSKHSPATNMQDPEW